MDFENEILYPEEKWKLSILLLDSKRYRFSNMTLLLDGEVKSFIAPLDHILSIYKIRHINTSNLASKTYLEYLISDLSNSKDKFIRTSFIGPVEDRIIIFTDVDFQVFHGLVPVKNSKYVELNE